MLAIPAIDIRHGKCVRLYQGRPELETVYSTDPVEMAISWAKRGAPVLHVADLDGALNGRPENLALISKMRQRISIPIQAGGGYRDMASIDAGIKAGVSKIILGTVAIQKPELVAEALERYGSAIAVSIDVAGDFVAVSGWKELSAVRFEELAVKMTSLGLQELLFTDTRKDGTLSGPNFSAIERFLRAARVPVIVSGGISSLDDITALKPLESMGLKGVVIGKALYDQKLTLEDALRVASSLS